MTATSLDHKKPTTLVACEIFADELPALAAARDPDLEVVWLPAALHTDIDRLKVEIETLLADLRGRQRRPCLFYGSGCLPDATELFCRHGARGVAACNCIEAFLGQEERRLYEAEGCFLMTPGWVRCWPAITAALGWDAVDVRNNLGRYAKIVVLDAGLHPLSDAEIIDFFDLTGLFVETVPLSLDHFDTLIARLLAQDGS